MHSTFTAREAAEIVAPHMFPERAREDAQRRHYEAEARRVSGVCVSGLGPAVWTSRSDAEIDAAERAAAAEREAYLTSNLGKARTKIAEGSRKAEQLHAQLQDVGAALSRGDGSAIRKAEDVAASLRDLRLLVADMEAFVRLSEAGASKIAAE